MKLSREFPAQTGAYRLQVKNGAGWHGFDTARLHISVGQPYHEGAKFKTQADWVSHRFGKAIVCVNDVLQRYNLMRDGMPEDEAVARCREAGQQWVARNRNAIEALSGAVIRHWDDWTEEDAFAAQRSRIGDLYERDRTFREAVDNEVLNFWQRRGKGLTGSFRFSAFKTHSTSYLLEETAAFFVMFEQERAADIYPGSTLLPCALAKRYGAGDATHFTRIDFKRGLAIKGNRPKAA